MLIVGVRVCVCRRDFFQLDESMPALHSRWGRDDKRMQQIGACLPGLRVLRCVVGSLGSVAQTGLR